MTQRWDRVLLVLTSFLLVALIVITIGLQIQVQSRNKDIRTVNTATAELRTIVGTVNTSTTRTECIRAASAALEAARWHTIAELVSATSREQARTLGEQLKSLPNLIDLAATGGVVNGERVEACPPITTTTKGTP